MPPKHWPPGVTYLPTPAPDPALTLKQQRDVLAAYRALSATPDHPKPQQVAPTPSACVRITAITDSRHPAYGQYGLTAAKKLTPGQLILPYVGYVTMEPHCSQTSNYILRLAGDVALDAELAGNEARFVNDFRGVAGKPNCCFSTFVDQHGQLHMGVFVGSKAAVAKGEELLVSYGKGFWRARQPGDGEDGCVEDGSYWEGAAAADEPAA